jgi:hypothetical protein
MAQQLKALLIGQAQIEDDQIGLGALGKRPAERSAVMQNRDLEARASQIGADHRRQLDIIFDEQDPSPDRRCLLHAWVTRHSQPAQARGNFFITNYEKLSQLINIWTYSHYTLKLFTVATFRIIYAHLWQVGHGHVTKWFQR